MYMNMKHQDRKALQNSYYLDLLYTHLHLGDDNHGLAQWFPNIGAIFAAVVT